MYEVLPSMVNDFISRPRSPKIMKKEKASLGLYTAVGTVVFYGLTSPPLRGCINHYIIAAILVVGSCNALLFSLLLPTVLVPLT